MKKIVIFLLMVILLLTGCNDKKTNKIVEEKKVDSDYELNETFRLMDFDVTVNDSIEIINNDEIIKIPVEVKNTGNENGKLSMFYYKFFNSQDEEISSLGSSYDDSLDYASALSPYESYIKYLYYPKENYKYYYIEFNDTYTKYKVGIDK